MSASLRLDTGALCEPDIADASPDRGDASNFTPASHGAAYNLRHPAIPAGGAMTMDKNRTEGAKNQIKGTAKEVAGKVTGKGAGPEIG